MERKLLFLLLFCIATIVNAKSEPIITLNVEPDGSERTLEFEVSTPNTKLFIDWGDGNINRNRCDTNARSLCECHSSSRNS